LKLVVKSEASFGSEELLLSGGSHGIGRLHDNDLSIQIDCISGYHAELKRTPEGDYLISDLKSTNGTFLNGNRVTSPEKVRPGDHLKLGNVLVMVEEQIEAGARQGNGSFHGDSQIQIVSLKDVFGFESGDHLNTYPITPVRRTPPDMAHGSGVPLQPVRMAPPVRTPGTEAQQIEQAREAERIRQVEQAREAERVRQSEQARETERVRQIEQARETERARQIEQVREAERVRQIEQAREAERVRQVEQAREAERVQQIERAREAERVRQTEQAREAERARQIEQAREAERVRQIEQARVAERARQIERAREAEQTEVDLRESPEPRSMDIRSTILGLTTQLESAMREISRLKAFIARESPGPVEMNGQGAGPANPTRPMAQGGDEPATRRSGNVNGKGMPAGQERDLREGDRGEARAASQNFTPLQSHRRVSVLESGISPAEVLPLCSIHTGCRDDPKGP
ncbi:MAG: FHA domain-containing protein, partial [Verrucomicrobiales bacterium]